MPDDKDSNVPPELDTGPYQAKTRSKYWCVDFPGLTQVGAERLVQLAAAQGIEGFSVDPDAFLTIGIDEPTAATIAQALSATQDRVAQGMFEVITEWLTSPRSG